MAPSKWISPAQAMDMLYNDPDGPDEDFGFALLRPRARNKQNKVADLARAKLQPVVPAGQEAGPRGWPVTAHSHRLHLAPGVPDVVDLGPLFASYDEAAPKHLTLLAAVLTLKFSPSIMLHDQMSAVSTYSSLMLSRKRQLTSLLAQHRPGEALSSRRPHLHVVVLSRIHDPSGWAHTHPDLCGDEIAMHRRFRQEWRHFLSMWSNLAES